MIDTVSFDDGFLDSWTLILDEYAPSDCVRVNDRDTPIPAVGRVDSTIEIDGCPGNGYVASAVEVRIAHPRVSDLKVSLIAPDGTIYVLHNQTDGAAANINQTFWVNLSSHARNGTWKPRVRDGRSSANASGVPARSGIPDDAHSASRHNHG